MRSTNLLSARLCGLAMMIGLSVSARAALVDMEDGTIYDTDTQLSWLKDAGAGGGRKTWDQAGAWAASLNARGGFAGLTGWRLPKADPTCGAGLGEGRNCTTGEVGHLYYTELRNTSRGHLTNTGPFTNLHDCWLDDKYTGDPDYAWSFNFDDGRQQTELTFAELYAWAVRPGARSRNQAHQSDRRSSSNTTSTSITEVEAPKRPPVAIPVRGHPDLVWSPYVRDKYIDISGYSPGAEVKDPYTGKNFLVPDTRR